MNTTTLLNQRIKKTETLLCVGLDPSEVVLSKIKMSSALFELNKSIIDTVADLSCAFKPQFAHYAALGEEQVLEKTCRYIKQYYPDIPVILDSKRGDIGSTADKYAQEAFSRYGADGVTINPYMGMDTIKPYFQYLDKAGIVLVKTSNPGSADLQDLILSDGRRLYEEVAERLTCTFPSENLWFVVGGTHPKTIYKLRQQCPEITFLVPGVGVQGGDVEAIIRAALNVNGTGLIINVSRGITAPEDDYNTLDEYLRLVRQSALAYFHKIKQYRMDYLKSI